MHHTTHRACFALQEDESGQQAKQQQQQQSAASSGASPASPTSSHMWPLPAIHHRSQAQAQAQAQDPCATAYQDSSGAMVWYNPLSLRMPPGGGYSSGGGAEHDRDREELSWGDGPVAQKQRQQQQQQVFDMQQQQQHMYDVQEQVWFPQGSMEWHAGTKQEMGPGEPWAGQHTTSGAGVVESRETPAVETRVNRVGMLIALPYNTSSWEEPEGTGDMELSLMRSPEGLSSGGPAQVGALPAGAPGPGIPAASGASLTPSPEALCGEAALQHAEDDSGSSSSSGRSSSDGSAEEGGEALDDMDMGTLLRELGSLLQKVREEPGGMRGREVLQMVPGSVGGGEVLLKQEVLQQLGVTSFTLDGGLSSSSGGGSGASDNGSLQSLPPAAGVYVCVYVCPCLCMRVCVFVCVRVYV